MHEADRLVRLGVGIEIGPGDSIDAAERVGLDQVGVRVLVETGPVGSGRLSELCMKARQNDPLERTHGDRDSRVVCRQVRSSGQVVIRAWRHE